jgi:hypothetical protein
MWIPEEIANAPALPKDAAEMAANPTVDFAHAILAAHSIRHSISQDALADGYDAYHAAKDPGELQQLLSRIELPNETKSALLQAKEVTQPMPTAVDRVVNALNTLSKMDPVVRSTAEAHPTVVKMLTDAATKE